MISLGCERKKERESVCILCETQRDTERHRETQRDTERHRETERQRDRGTQRDTEINRLREGLETYDTIYGTSCTFSSSSEYLYK